LPQKKGAAASLFFSCHRISLFSRPRREIKWWFRPPMIAGRTSCYIKNDYFEHTRLSPRRFTGPSFLNH
jgi:hypothetical protein